MMSLKPFLLVFLAIALALILIELLVYHHNPNTPDYSTELDAKSPIIVPESTTNLPYNLVPFRNAAAKTTIAKELKGNAIHLETCHAIFTPKLRERTDNISSTPSNIVLIFTGRWFFLRIQLPHIYRELRQNGGIIDKVWFVMIKWKSEDYEKLQEFAKVANKLLQDEVFVFHNYQDYNIHMSKPYTYAYCEILANLLKYPLNRYFKIDDDVVYIHPKAFERVVENKMKQNNKCLLNLFNTAGGNWMCNKMYQDRGVLGEVDNPDHIDYFKVKGEGNIRSTKHSLNVFLHFQKTNQLEKLFIDSIFWNTRYTFNGAMFDADTFDYQLVKQAGPLKHDEDEPWWTDRYPVPGDRSNCITGDTVIVHFSHSGWKMLAGKAIKLGLLDRFEEVVIELHNQGLIKMDDKLWKTLEYT